MVLPFYLLAEQGFHLLLQPRLKLYTFAKCILCLGHKAVI